MEIQDYTDKSFVLFGDETKKYKDLNEPVQIILVVFYRIVFPFFFPFICIM